MNTFFYRHHKFNEKPHIIILEKIPFNELTFVLKGQLDYEIDGKQYSIKDGDAIYLKSGSLRKRNTTSKCDYISFNFYDDMEINLPIHITECISEEIKLLFSVCDQIYFKYYDWFEKFDIVLNLIIKLLSERIKARSEKPISLSVKMYIRNNLANKLTLLTIANSVGYSPNYLDTTFKKITGLSVVDYIINERINEAKRLLDEGVLSLRDIAFEVGFEDYNYFSRTFKKRVGKTPTEYKNMIHQS